MNQMSRWDFPKAKKITHEFKYIYMYVYLNGWREKVKGNAFPEKRD